MTARVMIDTCVLYATLTRALVLGTARLGAFTPLWSPRILSEWRHAAAREGAEAEVATEIARLTAEFPDACVTPDPAVETRLSLPDPADTHVLAAAIAGPADELLTANLRDFPTRILADHGIIRRAPDEFLLESWHANPGPVSALVATQIRTAQDNAVAGQPRAILKRARLPRLGKALYGSESGP